MAFADTEHGYSRIFIFGASFMDSGNHFAVTGETAHPPFEPISFASYGVGGHRPTNGHTWVEVLAQEMKLTEWAKPAYRNPAFGNYAYAYARAREVDPPYITYGPSLSQQVQDWIGNGHCTGAPMNNTLFVLDTAYADMLDILQGANPDPVLSGMLDSIATNIGILYGCGARNLLIANLPPMGASPGVAEADKAAATGLSWMYNLFVQDIIAFYSDAMSISTFDFFGFLTMVMTTPEAFGFTNVTDACVTPYVIQDAFCKDRDEYLFWDQLHPTKKAHALMGEFALGQLPVLD
jgi:phospholipase/lecithinase/hemolysin